MADSFPARFLTAFAAAAPQDSAQPQKSWMQRIVEHLIAQQPQQPQAQVGETYGDTPMASPKGRRRAQYSPGPAMDRTLIGANTLNQSMLGGTDNLLGG
jgi:hypothetical protein